jgi:tetratricopeptide (TPR) repeat protein
VKNYLIIFLAILVTASPAFAQSNVWTFDWSDFSMPRCENESCKCQAAQDRGFETLAIKFCTEGLAQERLSARQRATLYILRGIAFIQRGNGNYDDAVNDEGSGIRAADTDGQRSAGHIFRAIAYFRKKDDVAALEDLNQAIALNSRDIYAYAWRAYVHGFSGDEKSALADLDTVEEKSRDPAYASQARGTLYMAEGKFEDAASSFERAVKYRHTNPEYVLYLHLAKLNAGVDDHEEFATNARHANLNEWPGPLVKMFTGEITPADATAAVNKAEYQYYEPMNRICDATFSKAVWAQFVRRDEKVARQFYEHVLSMCPRTDEVAASQIILKNLGS